MSSLGVTIRVAKKESFRGISIPNGHPWSLGSKSSTPSRSQGPCPGKQLAGSHCNEDYGRLRAAAYRIHSGRRALHLLWINTFLRERDSCLGLCQC